MAGFLLNGWRVFVPGRDGRPLHDGKVCFYAAGSSTPANVFSDKELEVPYGTELPLDNSGFLPPNVWLETTHLYKCVVKQKIQNDPETWQTMWVIDDVGYIDEFALDFSDTLRFVNSIAELKALVPGTYDYVYVMGWSVPGDTGSPMAFKWEASSTEDSDDGHWITPASEPASGRWEQLFNDGFVDPRKFGAIPDTDELVDDAIVRAMLYASEPNTFDPVSEIVYKPKEVRFVRSGNYNIGGSIDFSIYKMIPGYGSAAVPVTICDGVVFTSDEDVSVTFGPGTKIESSIAIVDGNVSLDFLEGSVKAVRPQWWYGNDMGECLVNAAATDNDVEVYGDVSRFNHSTIGYREVSGKGTVKFSSPVFQFDVGTALHPQAVIFDCLVEAPHESMLYGTEEHVGLSLVFRNGAQVIKDSWFVKNGDYTSGLISALDSAYDGDSRKQAHVEVIGGTVTEDVSPQKTALCKFVGKLTISGCTVENVLPENGPEKIFDLSNGGRIACAGDRMLVEWFGDDLESAFDSCSEGGYLESGVLSNIVNLGDVDDVPCNIRGMKIYQIADGTGFSGKVVDCVLWGSGEIKFYGDEIELVHNKIVASSIEVNPNNSANSIRIEGNEIAVTGQMSVTNNGTTKMSIVGNVFGNDGSSAKIVVSMNTDCEILGNSGSNVSSENQRETVSIDSTNIEKMYLMLGLFRRQSVSWTRLTTIVKVPVTKKRPNQMASLTYVGPVSIETSDMSHVGMCGCIKTVQRNIVSEVFFNTDSEAHEEFLGIANGTIEKGQTFPAGTDAGVPRYFIMDSDDEPSESNIVHDDGINLFTIILNKDVAWDGDGEVSVKVPISYEVL